MTPKDGRKSYYIRASLPSNILVTNRSYLALTRPGLPKNTHAYSEPSPPWPAAGDVVFIEAR